MASVESERKLLTVQSHVVSGYAGNRSATFPLQVLGWDVDVVNTVHFSNHTGYGRWGGIRFDAAHIKDIFTGLKRNGLVRYERMLSGYSPSAEVLREIVSFVQYIKANSNPNLIYLLDPVMGDMGRGMYVSESVVPLYKEMLQHATIACPNQFEAQVLTEQEISTLNSLYSVLWTLHNKYRCPNVVITSVDLSDADLARIGAKPKNVQGGSELMTLIGSSFDIGSSAHNAGSDSNPQQVLRPWFIQFPEVPGYFSGVGDTFSALLVGRYDASLQQRSDSSAAPTAVARAAELAIASLQSILSRTEQFIKTAPPMPDDATLTTLAKAALPEGQEWPSDQQEIDKLLAAQRRVETMRPRELKIVQSKRAIEEPKLVYRALSFAGNA
ncbi:putative pyridoxal kinase [Tilletia horrida]|uniref:pyridoxal kinase n=1 Tax=Tilletia horrida TaxID=155126 RepID=A0AAN6GVD4_9BASI|nr:putative pyridoxal kinase [Tilletia horrida]KAK0557894.1 putative pyridoxal kinase [Tilletia horrida]